MEHVLDLENELTSFSQRFDTAYEDKALSVRGDFLQSYPIKKIENITLNEYVIGKGTASFCACVEAKTRAWANMQGATSFKFGIYFGKTKSDSKKEYRFTKKFGDKKGQAFKNVKKALLNLLSDGQSQNFEEVDSNPLSQMFKAKILSLYFPEIYLNICSAEHIKLLALELGISEEQPVSQCQHLLFKSKLANRITKDWSNPKYMSFLYAKYIRRDLSDIPSNGVTKPKRKIRRKVNFEDISLNRDIIGKISEEFAIEWERKRLIGLGYDGLVNKIKDLRDIPSHGYDYLSYNAPGSKRYIEVKSVGKDKKEECFRFYLSENERIVSESEQYCDDYYFYLVFYGKDGKPSHLLPKPAKEFYVNSEVIPCAYVVRFNETDQK